MPIYEPKEDSFLLLKQVAKYSKGAVLDLCTGTGIQAKEASKTADFVIGLDINPEAIEYCKNHIKAKNTLFAVSNMFEFFKIKRNIYNIENKYDLIIVNPPYLPSNPKIKDIALDGGKKGYEFIEEFLKQAKQYLKPDGKILLLFSSLTNKEKVDEIIKINKFKYKQLDSLKLDFEELFVYLIETQKP